MLLGPDPARLRHGDDRRAGVRDLPAPAARSARSPTPTSSTPAVRDGTRCGCWLESAASPTHVWTRCSASSGCPTQPGGGSAATPWACGSDSASVSHSSPTRRR
jgi:hypothetical protein